MIYEKIICQSIFGEFHATTKTYQFSSCIIGYAKRKEIFGYAKTK